MFQSILSTASNVSGTEFIVCSLISLAFGVVIALVHCFKNIYSRNLILALVLLPVAVQTVIMLVNGNVGTGIAVLGAFSLVRFRSQPGNAREITSSFLAMLVGLAMSMGFVGISAVVVAIISCATIILTLLNFGDLINGMKDLKITIPENLDYEGLFDEIFDKYTSKCDLIRVKSTNMGSLFELHYVLSEKKGISEKAFIDELRCRNGNLNISLGRAVTQKDEL